MDEPSPAILPPDEAEVWRIAFASAWANHDLHREESEIDREPVLSERQMYAELVADDALRAYRVVCRQREGPEGRSTVEVKASP